MENRLEYLIKQNKRKKELGNCKNQFSKILNTTIQEEDFLNIERTVSLTKKFYESYKRSKGKICEKHPSSETEEVEKVIKKICSKLSTNDGYLITKQTEDCGLLRVSITNVLLNYAEVINFDQDCLCILTTDEREGIYIDYFEEANNDVFSWYYELCYWEV